MWMSVDCNINCKLLQFFFYIRVNTFYIWGIFSPFFTVISFICISIQYELHVQKVSQYHVNFIIVKVYDIHLTYSFLNLIWSPVVESKAARCLVRITVTLQAVKCTHGELSNRCTSSHFSKYNYVHANILHASPSVRITIQSIWIADACEPFCVLPGHMVPPSPVCFHQVCFHEPSTFCPFASKNESSHFQEEMLMLGTLTFQFALHSPVFKKWIGHGM